MNIFLLRQPIFKNDPKSLIISFFVGNFWPRGFADAVLGKAYLLKSWGKWFQWNISIKIKIFIPLNLIANDNVFEWYPKIFFIYFCTYSRAFALCCAQYLIIRYWPKRLCQRPANFEWKVCKNIDPLWSIVQSNWWMCSIWFWKIESKMPNDILRIERWIGEFNRNVHWPNSPL